MAPTPRTPAPAPERAPPPVPTPPPPLVTPPTLPVPNPPPPLETPPPPSPSSSQPGDEYHTPAPSLADGSPREETSFPSDGNGREGGAPPKSPQLSPMRLAAPRLLPPPSPRTRTGQSGHEEEAAAAGTGTAAAPAREPLRLATKGLARSPSSQRSLATTNSSPLPSPSPTPPSPLTPAAPVVHSSSGNNNNRSGQSTPKRAAETKLPLSSPAATAAIAVHFDPVEEAVTSPLHLGGKAQRLDHYHQQQQQHAAAAENGGSVPPDVAAAVAVGERRALSVTLRLATAVLSLAAFSVIASARTSGWAGDYYAHHLQYRYAVAVNVIVCAYSIAQSFGEIRRLISTRFIFRSMSSYYCSLFLDQALAYLLMSASSAAASRNDLWVSRFGTDAFNRKITSALWLSFIAFLMLALNTLISTANLFSML
ncbi:unnamed protein product [Miscanthus lutarioriparius]|uniref:CASP-like protein n=1 Tax=Miscanthus lutarioriparius TaxID=422564 RepID=A0A811PB94_9POAL|nr:unnamed protein product [Miscanthus lutarioriparius]